MIYILHNVRFQITVHQICIYYSCIFLLLTNVYFQRFEVIKKDNYNNIENIYSILTCYRSSSNKGVATLIKLNFKPSFKLFKAVVQMTQKRCWFEAWFESTSNHLQTYLQATLQTRGANVNFLFTPVQSWLKVSLMVV